MTPAQRDALLECARPASEDVDERAQLVLRNLDEAGLGSMLELVAARYGVRPSDIAGRSKKKSVVAARHELWLAIYRARGKSATEIGDLFGGVEHTSILHGIKAADERRAERLEAA